MSFVHLHWHSQYSLLEGIGSIPDILKQAETLGMSAIAITDYYALYGALEFYQKAKKANIQAIIGVELPLVHDISLKKWDLEHLWFVTILANNWDGYKSLLKLVSAASTTWYHHKPRVDRKLLAEYQENLTILLWWEQSVIASQLEKNLDYQAIHDLVSRIADTMWGKIIVEYCVQDYSLVPLAKQINETVLKLVDQWWYLLTCANNYHYIKADEQEAFEIALAIRDQKLYQDRDRRKVLWQYHIMSEDEIRTVMSWHGLPMDQIDAMINNTVTAAEQLLIKMPPLPAMFPSYDPPADIQELYEKMKNQLIVYNS
jgi:DNA polymerase III subunit alpha